MPNPLENTDLLTQETLMHAVNELSVYPLCDKQWEDKFAKDGAKVGDTIRIRKPVNFDIRDGAQFAAQALQDPYLSFSVDQQFGVDFQYSSVERTMTLDRMSERYLQPLGRRIANEIDLRIARAMARGATLYSGTPGTPATSVSTYQTAKTYLDDMGGPKSGVYAIQTPAQQQAIITDLRGLIEPGSTIAGQNREGRMRKAFGISWDYDQNLYTHVTGAVTGSGLVKGASQTGASIITDDWTVSTTGILKQGDKLQFGGAYAVNPITGATLGWLRVFTVTADCDSDSSGECTVPIDPPITITGPYKTCSASPDNDTGVLLFGHVSTYASKTSPMNLVFHKSACAVAVIGLAKPNGGANSSYMSDPDAGISIRMTQQYDIDNDMNKVRADVLIGIKMQLPDRCCVVPA